ncbi:MAG: nickel ABC transporter permease [Candidatus Eutrophobiaceae bacterium]
MNYLLQRLGNAAVVVFGATTLVFLLIHLVPGDPVEVILGEAATVADREQLRESMGLNDPLLLQWQRYMVGLLSLDLGHSLYSAREVSEILLERMPASAMLGLASLTIALLIAMPLGILAALHSGTWLDRCAIGISILGVSIPNFWMGPLLILVFSLWLGWFPVSGHEGFLSIVLPAVTLGTALAAILSRMIRASLLEVLNEEYIRAARARGLSSMRVVLRHALRNAALPVITILGMQLGVLLAGAVVTETVFSWPGVGQLMIDSIQRRDYPVLQGCVLLISLSYVLINLCTDFCYGLVDPRIGLTE